MIPIIHQKGYFITSIMDDTGFTICIGIKEYTKVRHSNKLKYLHSMLSQFGWKSIDAHAWKNSVKSSALDNLKKHIKKMHTELIPAKPSIQQ